MERPKADFVLVRVMVGRSSLSFRHFDSFDDAQDRLQEKSFFLNLETVCR